MFFGKMPDDEEEMSFLIFLADLRIFFSGSLENLLYLTLSGGTYDDFILPHRMFQCILISCFNLKRKIDFAIKKNTCI